MKGIEVPYDLKTAHSGFADDTLETGVCCYLKYDAIAELAVVTH